MVSAEGIIALWLGDALGKCHTQSSKMARMLMQDRMNDGVAIVTGSGTGIGAATVRLLAARGVRCVINYASSRD
jgi:hypothetical protein